MAFTRFHDDPARIQKQVEESSFSGKYSLNVPGPGNYVPFFEDPHFRLQRFGTNIMTNTVNLESDLMGLGRKMNHGRLDSKQYTETGVSGKKVDFPTQQPFVEESRASHPAWMYRERDAEHSNWSFLPLDPQHSTGTFQRGSFGLAKQFDENVATRILEKDGKNYNIQPATTFSAYDILPMMNN